MTAADVVPDPELLAARAVARRALEEITDARSIGAESGHEVHEERLVTLFFECRLEGYPGWRWAATLTRVDSDAAVNVLEVELLPGEGAVIAPEWVPWSERLAQFRRAQALQASEDAAEDAASEAAEAEAAASELSEEDDAEDDLLDNDFSDFDDELDGVDIDDDDDEDDFDDESDDDSDEDDSDDDADADADADADGDVDEEDE
ncbi:DUF3027 domain-containing protein [Leucobacter sp. HY1910]